MNIKKIADKTFGWMPEYMILDDAWKEMKSKNLVGGDNYYHRLGMCRAAQLKNAFWPSDKITRGLGVFKEMDDFRQKVNWKSLNGDSKDFVLDFLPSLYIALLDSKKDFGNNDEGINLGLQNPNTDCRILLKNLDYVRNKWKK